MRALLALLMVLLALLAVLSAALSLGALASLNGGSSTALAALSAAEALLAGRLRLPLEAFWRAVAEGLLACLLVWLAAYVKPR
ncbi:hypothetical protein [Deinococcus sonorensis]|uniref:Uncharacterized protein n=2 Tax=Deinococcus sonorensis TaxID=309891 RepID=A0AAU7UES5_9DEIO